jgi:hypothetical protein
MLVGNVDMVRSDQVAGWAADTDSPDSVVAIVVLVNGQEVAKVQADRLRADLRGLGKYGDGYHGFLFRFDQVLTPTEEHTVLVRFAQTNQMLAHGQFRIPGEAQSGVIPPVDGPGQPPGRSADGQTSSQRYVIHIGMPKTGTKYLQASFCRHRAEMLASGIYYPTEYWPELQIFAHHELVGELRQIPNPRLEEIFNHLNASGHRTILLSCEGFMGVSRAQLEYLKRLMRDADTRIVFYARRWSDWIPSQWQQTIKQGKTETFAEMYAKILATASGDLGINYNKILDQFSAVFGRAALDVVPYSTILDRGGDIFTDFTHEILGWDPQAPQYQDLIHQSMGIFLTELMRCLNVLEVERNGISGYYIFEAFHAVADNPGTRESVDRLFKAMEEYVADVIVDDECYPFRTIFDQINARYAERLVGQRHGNRIFEPRRQVVRFVRPEFLLVEGCSTLVRQIHEAIVKHLAARRSLSAA